MADFCFKCGAKLDDTSKFCRNCGTPVRKRETEDNVSYKAANPIKCVYCGAELKATAKFCPSCGKQQTESTKLTQTPEQTYAKIPGPLKCVCCGAELKATAKFCPSCGKQQTESTKLTQTPEQTYAKIPGPLKCECCGAELKATAKFCPKCGSPVIQGQIQNLNTSYQPQPQPQPAPKANSGSVMKTMNAVLLLAVLALIIVGASTIPGNLKTETLPPVGFADVQPDAEVDADYETLASGGTLLGEAPDDDWAAYVTHETPEWYYADEDE